MATEIKQKNDSTVLEDEANPEAEGIYEKWIEGGK